MTNGDAMTTLNADLAQYRVAVQRFEAGFHRLAGLIDHPVLRAHPDVLSSGRQLISTLRGYLRGANGPFRVIGTIDGWGEVRGLVSSVSGDLQQAMVSVDYFWKGRAADAYRAIVPPHPFAALRTGFLADRAQSALGWSVGAATAFYIGLVGVVIQLIFVIQGVVAAASTVVLSGPAVSVGAGQLALTAAEVVVFVGLFFAVVTTQIAQVGNLLSEAEDQVAFPDGQWPPSTTAHYTDATVTDGDAEWSLER